MTDDAVATRYPGTTEPVTEEEYVELYTDTTPEHVQHFVERFAFDHANWEFKADSFRLSGLYVFRGVAAAPSSNLCLMSNIEVVGGARTHPEVLKFVSVALGEPTIHREQVIGWVDVLPVSPTRVHIRTGPKRMLATEIPEVVRLFADLDRALTGAYGQRPERDAMRDNSRALNVDDPARRITIYADPSLVCSKLNAYLGRRGWQSDALRYVFSATVANWPAQAGRGTGVPEIRVSALVYEDVSDVAQVLAVDVPFGQFEFVTVGRDQWRVTPHPPLAEDTRWFEDWVAWLKETFEPDTQTARPSLGREPSESKPRRERYADPAKREYIREKVREYESFTKSLGASSAAADRVKDRDGNKIPRSTLDGWRRHVQKWDQQETAR